jgi:hypothetical protein
MKRCAVFVVIFVSLLGTAHGQSINKAKYKAIGVQEYQAAGAVKERTDTELFKMEFKFVLQAANSVAVQDAKNTLYRFTSDKKLNFERGTALVLYISSTHAEAGGWEKEIIDLAEPKPRS